MKKVMITVFVLTVFANTGCRKDKQYCYECRNISGNPNYQDAGCMTKDQWSTVVITDPGGNGSLDKNANCRKK